MKSLNRWKPIINNAFLHLDKRFCLAILKLKKQDLFRLGVFATNQILIIILLIFYCFSSGLPYHIKWYTIISLSDRLIGFLCLILECLKCHTGLEILVLGQCFQNIFYRRVLRSWGSFCIDLWPPSSFHVPPGNNKTTNPEMMS